MSIYLHGHINTCWYGHECVCRCVLCRSREVWKFVQQSRRNVYLLEIILFHFIYKVNKSNRTLRLVAELGGTQGTQKKYKGRWNWENLFQHFLSCHVIMHWSCPSMKGHCTKQAALFAQILSWVLELLLSCFWCLKVGMTVCDYPWDRHRCLSLFLSAVCTSVNSLWS